MLTFDGNKGALAVARNTRLRLSQRGDGFFCRGRLDTQLARKIVDIGRLAAKLPQKFIENGHVVFLDTGGPSEATFRCAP